MCTPDERNGTVRAATVTSFRNLQVSVRPVVRPQPRRFLDRDAAQRLHDRIQIPCPEPEIDFGDKSGHLSHIPLRKTAEDHQPSNLAGLIALGRGKDGLDGLLLRVTDESASVDQKHVHRTSLILRHDAPRILDLRKEMFGVHGVLGTA